MKLLFCLLLFLSLVLAFEVAHVRTPNINNILSKSPNLIVLFIKEHDICIKIDQSFRKLSSKLANKHSLHFAVAMFQQNPQIFSTYKIQAVPEIIFYKDGKRLESDYNGLYQHSVQQLEAWINQKFQKTLPRVNKIIKENISAIIDIGCKHENKLLDLRIKDNHNNYFCSDSQLDGHSVGEIILVTANEIFKYRGQTPLYSWIKTYEDGYLKPLTDYYIHKIYNSNTSYFVLLTHLDKNSEDVLPIYQQYAKNHINQSIGFIVSHINTNLQLQVQMMNFIGYNTQFPYPHLSFLTIEYDQLVKFHPDKIVAENITLWMDSVQRNEEPNFIKNLDYEHRQQPSAFSRIGHNDLINISKQEDAELFIYFYSQYCEQCVLKLGDLKHDLDISQPLVNHYHRYSVTENDIPYFADVDSVPTLVYIKGNHSILYLEEQHNIPNMLKFIELHNKNIQPLERKKNPDAFKEEEEDEHEEAHHEL